MAKKKRIITKKAKSKVKSIKLKKKLHQKKTQSNSKNKFFYWLPRIFAIAFILFISMFALDMFNQGYGLWFSLLGFLIHLIPSYLLIAALVIAWKWEHIGGSIFILLSLIYIWLAWAKIDMTAMGFIAGPPVLIGLFFLLDFYLKNKLNS